MKKFLTVLVLCLVFVFCAIGFTACDENTAGGQNTQILGIYNTYVAYAEENGETPLSYEEWLESIKGENGKNGEKGDKGDTGATGAQGEKGRTPEIRVLNGYIQWKYTDESEWHTLSTVEVVTVENPQELDFYLKDDGTYEVKVGKATLLTEIVIPSTYKGKTVTSIGNQAFSDCSNLRSITIPDSIITIGNEAFLRCNNITNIIIPNSVIEIGREAFNGCSALSEVKISDRVNIIGDNVFLNCSGLTNIVVDNNNPNYSSQDGILYDKNKAEIIKVPQKISGIINLPNTLMNISWLAFSGISGLTGIMVDDSNPNYSSQDGILYNKDKTDIVFVPQGISGAIILPSTLTSIGESAFFGCSSLTSITIPDSVTSIGSGAFSGCSGLTSIVVDDNNPNYSSQDGILYNKGKTEIVAVPEDINGEIVLPDTLITIRGGSFFNRLHLTSVVIPNSVNEIEDYAFNLCDNLVNITIGNGVWKIGIMAFYGCGATNITFNGTKDEWEHIVKGYQWQEFSLIMQVVCTDGIIDL